MRMRCGSFDLFLSRPLCTGSAQEQTLLPLLDKAVAGAGATEQSSRAVSLLQRPQEERREEKEAPLRFRRRIADDAALAG